MESSDTCMQLEKEHRTLTRILNFRLPHTLKKVGLITAVALLIILVAYKFVGSNQLIIKDALRTLLLFALLVATLSKDKLEDEYNRVMRLQSFVIAFVFTAGYAIVIPLIALVLDTLITYVSGDGVVAFYEMSAFEIIFTMLGMQLLCFEALKRFSRAE
jgi:hypothetical protein